ncbi:DNA-directed RNA polymerase subunit H [Candidatus Woesearchaeota archaeon]|nr:DNA-directed RNA polymerase subunit H [Candidatus Woesearchaeota archaeon]
MAQKYDVTKHVLVPTHTVVSEAEKKKIIANYNLSGQELPRILKEDPAIAHLKAKIGDIIKITRKSVTAGTSIFYRRVGSA